MNRQNGFNPAFGLTMALLSLALACPSSYAQAVAANPRELGYNEPADPYDLDAIKRNPDRYYSRSIPSRVWQLAPVPAGYARHEELVMQQKAFRFVLANGGKPIAMDVRAKPNRPVTFTALDTGHFANGKISITVPADEFGFAHADFWVGAAGDFRVLAGSPENQGPVEFTLQALSAAELHDLESGEYARRFLAKHPQQVSLNNAAPRDNVTRNGAR